MYLRKIGFVVLLAILTVVVTIALHQISIPLIPSQALAQTSEDVSSNALVEGADAAYREGNYGRAEELLQLALTDSCELFRKNSHDLAATRNSENPIHQLCRESNAASVPQESSLSQESVEVENEQSISSAQIPTIFDQTSDSQTHDLSQNQPENEPSNILRAGRPFYTQPEPHQSPLGGVPVFVLPGIPISLESISTSSAREGLKMADVLRKLGDIYSLQGRYDQALNNYQQANGILNLSRNIIENRLEQLPQEARCDADSTFSNFIEGLYKLGVSSFEISKHFESQDNIDKKNRSSSIAQESLTKAFQKLPVFRYTAPVDLLPSIREDPRSSLSNGNRTNIATIGDSTTIYTDSNLTVRTREGRTRWNGQVRVGVEEEISPHISITGDIGYDARRDRVRPVIGIRISGTFGGSRETSTRTAICLREDLPSKIESRIANLLQQILVSRGEDKTALLIADAGRTVEIDKYIAYSLEETNREKADLIKELASQLTLEEIKQVAADEKATLVNYSVISDEEVYIWVIKPSGEILFNPVDCIELSAQTSGDSQSSDDYCTLLREVAQNPPESLDPDRGSFSKQREIVRDIRASLGIDELNSETQQVGSSTFSSTEKLTKLYQLLIGKIENFLPTNPDDQVVFIPSGSLFFVPFPALQKNGDSDYLINSHTIRIVPNLRTLVLNHRNRPQRFFNNDNVLIVGNPLMPAVQLPGENYLRQLPKLPFADDEAKRVAEIFRQHEFDVTRFGQDQATENAIVRRMDNASVVHLATHGLIEENSTIACSNSTPAEIAPYPFDPSKPNVARCSIPQTTLQPISGQLALSPSANNDGWLTALDLLKLDLNKTGLVVLSACNTAQGQLLPGGVVGLPFSLSLAGVRTTIASLWAVYDKDSTVLLMESFYNQILNSEGNVNVAQALRQAMMNTMAKYPEPKYWAGFTLIGAGQ